MKGLHYLRSSLKCTTKANYVYGHGVSARHRFYSSTTALHSSHLNLGVVTFKLADIGEGIAEVELLNWHVKEGDNVDEMDPVCSVQSDKSAVEISTPFTGRILRMHHQIGDMIRIGEALTDIDIEGELPLQEQAAAHVEEIAPGSDGTEGPTSSPPIHRMDEAKGPSKEKERRHAKPMASPACRHLAAEFGIDLGDVTATGPGGRVTKEDILKHHESLKGKEAPAQPLPQKRDISSETIILKSGIAKAMVKAMNATLTIPTMSLQEDIDVTGTLKFRDQINQHLSSAKREIQKITLTPFIVKAISIALQRVPILNSKFDSVQQDRYVLYHSHNISIAIASPHGLFVPNIQNVQQKGLLQIQKELKELQTLATENKLQPHHLQGGTISISNIGIIGGTAVRPLNFDGQGAILGVGRLQTLPRYDRAGSAFEPREIVNITATVDHRHIDGATVALFIKLLRETLEMPNLLTL